ncbi:patatin-like phospholipase family protein [bacterium]|nr:patatin-like phospholipase family protein [bacterium]
MIRKKIGLALGSGSSRGWAHIGVLQCLVKNNIPISCVAGTSIGAYVGAIFAAGDLDNLTDFAMNMDKKTIRSHIDITFPKSGLLDGKRIPNLIKACTSARTFSDLSIPLKIPAADMISGEQFVFSEGSLFTAIRASVSVPGVLNPLKFEDKLFIDGGVINPVPVDLCREMGADICIAVDLNASLKGRKFAASKEKKEGFKVGSAFLTKLGIQYDFNDTAVVKGINKWLKSDDTMPNILEVLGASIDIMESRIAEINMELHAPDILVKPDLKHLRIFDFDQGKTTITEGYRVMEEQIPTLKRMLENQ